MVDVLQRRHEAIIAACVRHSVARLDAFGSALLRTSSLGKVTLTS